MEVINQGDNNSQEDETSICETEEESVSNEVPKLTSDEERRPMRSTRAPDRYDPSTSESYVQPCIDLCHNIVLETSTETPDYTKDDSKIVVILPTYIKVQCHGQQFMLSCGPKKNPDQRSVCGKRVVGSDA